MSYFANFSSLFLLVSAPFVGSFLGLLVMRVPVHQPVILARSRCQSCKRGLGWRDLIPVMSWAFTGGRCRYCRTRLSAFYPTIELAAFLIALWAVAVLPVSIAWIGAGFGWTLLALAAIDQRRFILPDMLTLPLMFAGLTVAQLLTPERILDHLLGGAVGFGGFWAIGWLYRTLRDRDGLGAGDVKLMGALGTWVAWQGVPTLIFYAAVAGLASATVMTVIGHRMSGASRIAFGPYLCLGGWLVWLYGPVLLSWQLLA
jgi:leader peptidase (prepilin peptidase)/N-methyltransferase